MAWQSNRTLPAHPTDGQLLRRVQHLWFALRGWETGIEQDERVAIALARELARVEVQAERARVVRLLTWADGTHCDCLTELQYAWGNDRQARTSKADEPLAFDGIPMA